MSEVAPVGHIHAHVMFAADAEEWLDHANKAYRHKSHPLPEIHLMLKFAEVNALLAEVESNGAIDTLDGVLDQRDQARDIAAALEAELALLKETS
jgi:hypothetical protein